MFLVWKEWRLMSLDTCLLILARACPSFRPKLHHFGSQNIPFSIYLDFGSSDFDETLRKCSSYKENEDWWVLSHVCPFLPGHAHQSSFSLYQEHFLKISSKSDEPNSRYIEKGIFWDQKWPNLGLNDGHARARMGEHVTKLVSLHSLYTKNISSKFHRNLMNQIQDILKTVYFGPNMS